MNTMLTNRRRRREGEESEDANRSVVEVSQDSGIGMVNLI